MLDPRDREALRLDRRERGSIAVAPEDGVIQPVHPILEAGDAWILGPDVLEEKQPATGMQDTPGLTQRARLVVDATEHERRDDGVEGVVLERKILREGLKNLRSRGVLAHGSLQAPDHGRLRLGEDERLAGSVVMREVHSRTRADLLHASGCFS